MNKIKKAVGYVGAWAFYWMGHCVSRLHNLLPDSDRGLIFVLHSGIFNVYHNLMTWSYDVQEWAGNDVPWVELKTDLPEDWEGA